MSASCGLRRGACALSGVGGWGRRGNLQVGVRASTREAGDGGVVDGDNEVALDVVAAARTDTGGVEGSCGNGHVNFEYKSSSYA